MPVVPGKVGSVRIRGKVRAQLQVGVDKIAEILTYNAAVGARRPPIVFLTAPQVTQLQNASLAMQAQLASRN
jgi:hypothetical protein